MRFCCLDSFWKKKTSRDQAPHNEIGDDVKVYPYAKLKIATNMFHLDIGSGGFGSVYKGTLKDGTVVAVKQLSAQSKHGVKEFLTEIATISDIQHEILVKLHGCCAEEGHRVLVYEYMEKNNIAQALLGSDNSRTNMDWTMRAKTLHEVLIQRAHTTRYRRSQVRGVSQRRSIVFHQSCTFVHTSCIEFQPFRISSGGNAVKRDKY
jgi:serine/threonine protein kinase